MDLLRTAVVDVTTLAATCRALGCRPLEGELEDRRKLRNRLRSELTRGTMAYVDTLARSKHGVLDDALLNSCRAAAEQQMPRALRYQEELKHLMSTEPGVLAGVAAARQDLWRLAHMAVSLQQGVLSIRHASGGFDDKTARKQVGRLRRRLRRALVAYARISHRSKQGIDRIIAVARRAALIEIGKRGATEADSLARLEARAESSQTLIRTGVARSLNDLFLDWGRSPIRKPGNLAS